ncbi:DUF397 domain-containing protein [Nocardiopsis sp. CNT-189]|uniref:DUF397 domain-containing protein n=1 Tax=Nocardiopsis oceanisediminis TaxID=2816862 RepID=UPI003B2FE9E8
MIWKKSSYSSPEGQECLEARDLIDNSVQIRDSKRPEGEILSLPPIEWISFIKMEDI